MTRKGNAACEQACEEEQSGSAEWSQDTYDDCLDDCRSRKGKAAKGGMDAGEEFFDAAETLYRLADRQWDRKRRCTVRRLPLAGYKELRTAFLPGRTKRDVQSVGDKVSRTAIQLLENTGLFQNGSEPSCAGLGLSELKGVEEMEYCSFDPPADRRGRHRLVCDCPEGMAIYDAKSFAKEQAVVCNAEGRPDVLYSDFPRGLGSGLRGYLNARDVGDVKGMVLGLDEMVNAVHGSGPMAKYFVVGGKATLDKLARE